MIHLVEDRNKDRVKDSGDTKQSKKEGYKNESNSMYKIWTA